MNVRSSIINLFFTVIIKLLLMKRTYKNNSAQKKHSQVAPYNCSKQYDQCLNLQNSNKYNQNLQSYSQNICESENQKTTCNIVQFCFTKQPILSSSTSANKQNTNTCIHRLKYKNLDRLSSVCTTDRKKDGQTEKGSSFMSEKQLYLNPSKKQTQFYIQKLNDPQNNETNCVYIKNKLIFLQKDGELDQILRSFDQAQKKNKNGEQLQQKLFNSYNISVQKNKLYQQIAQARNRKYSYKTQAETQKSNLLNINIQKQFSFGQNKNSVFSTLHSNSGEWKQIYDKDLSCYKQSLSNKYCYKSIDLHTNKKCSSTNKMSHNTNFLQKPEIRQSIIHKLDDFMEDNKVYKIDHNKQFIRRSKKNIQALPETDTCIQKQKYKLAKQNNQINKKGSNQEVKINSKQSIEQVKRKPRFTCLDECGYTIVSKYNKSEDRKSVMQESNILFQASKHVNQQQMDNQVSSNFESRVMCEMINKRNCRSFIQNEQSQQQKQQINNFVRQKTRNNFIRQKRSQQDKKEEFKLLGKYAKDEELSIRFDLNLGYQLQESCEN